MHFRSAKEMLRRKQDHNTYFFTTAVKTFKYVTQVMQISLYMLNYKSLTKLQMAVTSILISNVAPILFNLLRRSANRFI